MNIISYATAVVASHVEAWMSRINALLAPAPARHNGTERRHNPRTCVLCGGPMRPDARPPRDVRTPTGQIRRIPEEVMDWHRCSRCHRSQVGMRKAL